jgi:hypothetical protein
MLVSSSPTPPSPSTQGIMSDSRPPAAQKKFFGSALSRAATESSAATRRDQAVVILMAALQALPIQPLSPQQQEDVVATAYMSLARPMWRAEVVVGRLNATMGTSDDNKAPSRSLTDRYVGLRRGISDTVDRAPAHWLGIRYEGAVARERDAGLGVEIGEAKGGYVVLR